MTLIAFAGLQDTGTRPTSGTGKSTGNVSLPQSVGKKQDKRLWESSVLACAVAAVLSLGPAELR